MSELQLPAWFRGRGPWDDVGECIFTRHWDDGRLTVDRADPRVMVSAELLDEWRSGFGAPEVVVNGDVLTINASNRKVIYRIGEKVPDMYAYYAEWPD